MPAALGDCFLAQASRFPYLPRAAAVVEVFADRFLEVPGGRVSGLLLRIL
jgi:hypothetical protein